MVNNFKSSTRALFKLLGWDDRYHFRDENEEIYRVHEICVELSSRAYGEHGEEIYKYGTWVVDLEIFDAMRNALVDHQNNYAGQSLAYTLLRCGCRRTETLAQLHPWHRLMFRWHEEGYTANHIATMLQEAGIVDQLPQESIGKITSWLQNPASILDHISIICELFGSRVVYASLLDIGFEPRHDELFRDLAKSAVPIISLSSISQAIGTQERFKDVSETTVLTMQEPGGTTVEYSLSSQRTGGIGVFSDQDSHWVIQYVLNDATYQFMVDCKGTWMNVEPVIEQFNQLMDRINRREHAFRFGTGYEENGEWGLFIVADRDRFPQLAEQLHIPLYLPA
jgi:hypothetical protein